MDGLTSDIQLVEIGLKKNLDINHLVKCKLGLAKLSMNRLGSLLQCLPVGQNAIRPGGQFMPALAPTRHN